MSGRNTTISSVSAVLKHMHFRRIFGVYCDHMTSSSLLEICLNCELKKEIRLRNSCIRYYPSVEGERRGVGFQWDMQ